MAWGLWNKIKQGIRKAGNFLKKGVQFVADKVVKPFKPIISTAANIINPAFGKAVDKGMNIIEKVSDGGGSIEGMAKQWAKSKWG